MYTGEIISVANYSMGIAQSGNSLWGCRFENLLGLVA